MTMMELRDSEVGSQLTSSMSHGKPERQLHTGPILVKPAFNWDTQDMYMKLMNFKMEVLNILETKACKLYEEEKVPVIKNWFG